MAEEKLRLDEESLKALETLVEIAVKLKETGMLDMLRVLAEKSGEIFAYIGNDVALHRLAAVGEAALHAAEKLSPDDVISMRLNVEQTSECLFRALASMRLEQVKPVSTLGALSVLRDRDVQVGLGFLVALAKQLGSCLRSKIAEARR